MDVCKSRKGLNKLTYLRYVNNSCASAYMKVSHANHLMKVQVFEHFFDKKIVEHILNNDKDTGVVNGVQGKSCIG